MDYGQCRKAKASIRKSPQPAMAAISDSLMNSLATWLKQIRNHSPLETETPPRDSVTSGTLVGHHAKPGRPVRCKKGYKRSVGG